ncbi:tyrosine-protein phosphatase [Marinoscillum furvescens]|uniref:protein-tyrosine-phosphatase n=1 Tax=Marinoscillum furvescens DSM 4134 TaxID=1122208 RepID=A0A3D9KZY7_MARFU|nr:CpsB/CapC family capsule biosynthesis tyrosine phosphatase [Marinoscillum furvescens]RED92845.1 tyrosine-protein phosphatase YwqE [Marinoscillum furvescens DSM 4134]
MFSWFSNKQKIHTTTDIHSHLVPGIDDGVKSTSEALTILRKLASWGYERVITTPHIYAEYYPNTPEVIKSGVARVQEAAQAEGIPVKLEAAAEYFIDETLMERLKNKEELLCFGKGRYVLVETGFYSKPLIFQEVMFAMKTQGYTPILAHPERYEYLQSDFGWLRQIREQGVKLQVSIPSLAGLYGPQPRAIAQKLFGESLVDFVGSDIHKPGQLEVLKKGLQVKVKPNNLLNDHIG